MANKRQPEDIGPRALGRFLAELRHAKGMSLRQVEETARRLGLELSNAYLSQMENGRVAEPSPHILHTLATVYDVPYGDLMRKAGYYMPEGGARVGTFATLDLTADEEAELIAYLRFRREQRKR